MRRRWMIIGLVLVVAGCSRGAGSQGEVVNNQAVIEGDLSDPCEGFSDELVGSAIGKTIVSHELIQSGPSSACQYYTDESAFVSIVVNNMDPQVQRKGAEVMKRKVSTDEMIGIDNFVVTQEDGQINAVYLILGQMKFVRIDRSSIRAADNLTLMNLARKVASELK